MSEDGRAGGGSPEGPDGPGPRRRRRRRRPRGEAPEGGAPRSGGERPERAGGARAGGARAGGPRQMGGAPGSRAGAGPSAGPRQRPDGRRRRRRGGGAGGGGGRTDAPPARASRPPPPAPVPGAPATLDDVDLGWDDVPLPAAGAASAPSTARAARPTADDAEPAPRAERWGQDDDAPTPKVTLAPDLPPDPPADDPDPVTASLEDEGDEPVAGEPGPVGNPVGVKFTGAGKIYLYEAGEEHYRVGEEVVVDGERGPRIGTVAVAPARRAVSRGPLRRVLRRPSAGDRRALQRNQERAAELLRAARELARRHELPVKVFRAELGLGGGKATVYFSTEEKVDLRRLARDLSHELHLRVEMRQTGVRDEARMVGGIGSCGQELCCSTWLPAFVPVSIKNAKDQGLVLNPSKVSGQCGRLKCCLVYEQDTYAELRKGLPKLGKRVITEAGEGRVVEVDVLRQRVRVSLVQGDVQVFQAGEVKPMFPPQPPPGRPRDPGSS